MDAAIIGGGIAGISAAAFVAQNGAEATLFERESSLAYHTTGRSAALFTPNYGPQAMRAFAKVALPFFEQPPVETQAPLLSERGLLEIVPANYSKEVEPHEGTAWMDESECAKLVPILRTRKIIGGIHDPTVASIDVHGLHGLYAKMFSNAGGTVIRNAEVTELKRKNGIWRIRAGKQEYSAKAVINAAGAWADSVAEIAGIEPVGLVPKRRTVVLVDQGQLGGYDCGNWPMVATIFDYVYFQPFGKGRIMISPEDETPSPPCDAQPEELDIAIGIARFEEMTVARIKRIEHSWAGLRTFAPDRNPVIGWEPDCDGFFWIAGQGGYGIFSSPGIGRYAAELFCGNPVPPQIEAAGYDFSMLSPNRFRRQGMGS